MSIAVSMESKLRRALEPVVLEVINESHQHGVAPGSETHFRLLVVSPTFQGKSLVARHREIYGLLVEEMKSGVHALALETLTPEEWSERGGPDQSPPCLGGSKR